jgi:hypothetical protein
MACCGDGCEKRKEAMLDGALLGAAAGQGAFIINKLLEIAAAGGGLLYMFQNDPKLNELAAVISALAAENQSLKRQLSYESGPEITAEPTSLTIAFGPDESYILTIPIGGKHAGLNRRRLFEQLRAAITGILPPRPPSPSLPGQKTLEFRDA